MRGTGLPEVHARDRYPRGRDHLSLVPLRRVRLAAVRPTSDGNSKRSHRQRYTALSLARSFLPVRSVIPSAVATTALVTGTLNFWRSPKVLSVVVSRLAGKQSEVRRYNEHQQSKKAGVLHSLVLGEDLIEEEGYHR